MSYSILESGRAPCKVSEEFHHRVSSKWNYVSEFTLIGKTMTLSAIHKEEYLNALMNGDALATNLG